MATLTTVSTYAKVLADARSQKALEILRQAATWQITTLRHNGKEKVAYLIPGSLRKANSYETHIYTTNVNACSCPDFTRRFRFQRASYGHVNKHLACKHMLAVRLFTVLESAQTANGGQPRES